MPKAGEQLFGQRLPALIRGLTPRRIFFDRTRHARRLKTPPAQWAHPPKGFPPAHRHPTFEFCFLLGGRCPFLLGEERRQLARGDLVVLSPEVYHRELAGADCGPYELLWIACQRTGVDVHVQTHCGGGRFDMRAFHVWLPDFPAGLQLAETVDIELWQDRPGAFHRIQGLLLELSGLLERALQEQAAPKKRVDESENTQRWRVSRAVEYVRDHFAEPLDLPEVALHVGVSPGYLSALFTRAIGRSFTDFLASCRLEEAQRLLADPALSVKQIAARVGLDNPFYFSRLFRKHTGCSPKQYRQRMHYKK